MPRDFFINSTTNEAVVTFPYSTQNYFILNRIETFVRYPLAHLLLDENNIFVSVPDYTAVLWCPQNLSGTQIRITSYIETNTFTFSRIYVVFNWIFRKEGYGKTVQEAISQLIQNKGLDTSSLES